MTRPELTFEDFCLLPMQYTKGISADSYGLRMYRNAEAGLQREVYTPRNPKTCEWGDGKSSLFLDGDQREFANVAELYVAYMESACGINTAKGAA